MRYKIAESDSVNHVYFSGSDIIVGFKGVMLPYLEILVVYVTF